MPSTRAWLAWSVAVAAYLVAVFERTSLGVAGPTAVQQFNATPGMISTFVVVQLLVYSAAQVPAGIALDRFGSRRLITVGLLVLAAAQMVLAQATSVGAAIPARVLLGAGDALIFGSVVRLVPAWFAPSRVPLVTQVTGQLGQLGQVVSAFPFLALLHARGWRPAFLMAGLVAFALSLVVLAVVRDVPPGAQRAVRRTAIRQIPADVAEVWRHPGTRLGFWVHWTTCFPALVFALMWGFPYLTQGEGLSAGAAGALMSVFAVVGMVVAPVLGVLTGLHPLRRSNLVLTVIAFNLVPFVAVLCWPGRAPGWLLLVMCLGLATGGPGSAIAFDFVRSFLPATRFGTANGLVIVGGFSAALLAIWGTGLVVDALAPSGVPGRVELRLAMAVQLPVYAVGLIGILVSRRATRRLMAETGVVVPTWRQALARELDRRAR